MPVPQNSIVVNAGSDSKFLEAPAAELIRPGHWLGRNSSGEFVRLTEAAGTLSNLIVAVEDLTRGLDVDSVYAVGDTVLARFFRPGDLFYGLLFPAETVVYYQGVNLIANGEMQPTASITISCGQAMEAKTAGPSAVHFLIEAR